MKGRPLLLSAPLSRFVAAYILLVALFGCSQEAPVSVNEPPAQKPGSPAEPMTSPNPVTPEIQAIFDQASVTEIGQLTGLDASDYVAPLADAYERIDPGRDGWDTEAFHESANAQLGKLAKELSTHGSAQTLEIETSTFKTSPWFPPAPKTIRKPESGLAVTRLAPEEAPLSPTLSGRAGLDATAREFVGLFNGNPEVKFKHYRIEPGDNEIRSRARMEAKGIHAAEKNAKTQISAEWELVWTSDAEAPRLAQIELADWEQSTYRGETATMFEDRTAAVFDGNASFREHLLRPTDHWRSRLQRVFGLDVVANHGLALGDVNGDRLDDLYLCMQGGLPNRLFLRQPDGTLVDASAGSGTDWLDYCASALIVDFDNDGDRDLVVGQEWRILFLDNLGDGKFELAFGLGSQSQTFALAAADYDVDGDVDLYVCGYNTSVDDVRSGAMGEPMPYHDAQNGGANMLLRNDGNWEFNEVTAETGLNQNNNRFSFAAAWEDYDNDGDLDLYVANDYGRNNLYQNNGGRFRDVAGPLGLEDMSSGMSVAWGDHNRDGWMDLYVSNMFSAAGNRITYQRQFKTGETDGTRAIFQRHARGNSLFESTGDGHFRDVSEIADVTMGRWAWASAFVDINNDSYQDLIVANGFITTDDTGDL